MLSEPGRLSRKAPSMGKWETTPTKNLKKVQKTSKPAGFSPAGKAVQKAPQEPLTCVVAPFADRAAIFTERGGRGVLAEASEACALWVVLLIAGNDVGNFLHRLDSNLNTFMQSKGTTWEAYAENHCVKVATSNGYDPLDMGVKNWSRAIYFAVADPQADVEMMVNMLDDFFLQLEAHRNTTGEASLH